MYKIPERKRYNFKVNESVEGEPIEQKLERLLNNNDDEKMETKELLYTKPDEGIIADFNIRNDYWDDAAEKASIMADRAKDLDAAKLKKREELLKQKKDEDDHIRKEAQEKIKALKGSNGDQANTAD